jgi:hypothetical protein
LEELAPGSSATFNVTVRPKLFGTYESTRARLKYNNGIQLSGEEMEPEVKHGYSSSLGKIRIVSLAEDTRNNNYFVKEWLVFLVLCGIPTMGPFVLWQKTRHTPNEAREYGKKKSH